MIEDVFARTARVQDSAAESQSGAAVLYTGVVDTVAITSGRIAADGAVVHVHVGKTAEVVAHVEDNTTVAIVIPTGERSGLLAHIATTESVSLCARRES